MNTTKMLIASVIGAVINFLAGWLVYGFLLKDSMSKAMTPEAHALDKPEPNLAGIFISCLFAAFMLSYIFEKWAKIRTFIGGMTAGAFIGFLIAASIDIQFWSIMNMYSNPSFMIVDIAASTVMTGLSGGIIGWFLGFNRTD